MFFILALLDCFSVIAQLSETNFDSIQTAVLSLEDEEQKIEILIGAAEKYSPDNPREALKFALEAIKKAEAKKDLRLLTKSRLAAASIYSVLGEAESRFRFILDAKVVATDVADLATINNLLGQHYIRKDIDSAELYFYEYFRIVHQHELKEQLPLSYQQAGMVRAMQGDLGGADSLWEKGISLANDPQHDRVRTTLYYNLATLSFRSGNYARAMNFAQSAYDLSLKLNDSYRLMALLNILAKISIKQSDSTQAGAYYKESFDVILEKNYVNAVASNIGQSYIAHAINQGDIDLADSVSQWLYKTSQINQDVVQSCIANARLAQVACLRRLDDRGLFMLKETLADTAQMRDDYRLNDVLQIAISIFTDLDRPQDAIRFCRQIERALGSELSLNDRRFLELNYYKNYKKINAPANALRHFERFEKINQDMLVDANTSELLLHKTKFDTERKQLLLDNQEMQINLLEIERASRNRTFKLSAICLTILMASLYLYRSRKFLIKSRKMQKAFAQNLINTQEKERKRIARELHDGVGQNLVLVKNQMTKHGLGSEVIEQVLDEVRSVSRGLHPAVLQKFGLTAAIKNLMEEVDKNCEIFFIQEIENVDALISENATLHIYRIIQEAVTNIIKHSKTNSARVEVKQQVDFITFKIEDYGQGFISEPNHLKSSLGLKTMEERANIIGASLSFNQTLEGGASVILKVKNEA